jgi:hypothetical protein
VKQLLVASDGGQQLTCELTCLESLRLSYLLEPIRPVECDAGLMVVQMRSTPPQRIADEIKYFELTVGRSGLYLHRYSKHLSSDRRLIPVQVTREVLLKLVGDVESVLHDLVSKRALC